MIVVDLHRVETPAGYPPGFVDLARLAVKRFDVDRLPATQVLLFLMVVMEGGPIEERHIIAAAQSWERVHGLPTKGTVIGWATIQTFRELSLRVGEPQARQLMGDRVRWIPPADQPYGGEPC